MIQIICDGCRKVVPLKYYETENIKTLDVCLPFHWHTIRWTQPDESEKIYNFCPNGCYTRFLEQNANTEKPFHQREGE